MKMFLFLLMICVALTVRVYTEETQTKLVESPNGDYKLYIYGGRKLVCEEQPLKIVEDGDAVNPIVIECKHGGQ